MQAPNVLENTLRLSFKFNLIPSQMPLCLPKCQPEDFQVGREMSFRWDSEGCVCWMPKSPLGWWLMSFPVSGLLAEVPADAQMTSSGTHLSPGEITNGPQPQVPAAPRSHNSLLGLAVSLESRHPVLSPWLSPRKLCLSTLLKPQSGTREAFSKVLRDCNQSKWTRLRGHALLII